MLSEPQNFPVHELKLRWIAISFAPLSAKLFTSATSVQSPHTSERNIYFEPKRFGTLAKPVAHKNTQHQNALVRGKHATAISYLLLSV